MLTISVILDALYEATRAWAEAATWDALHVLLGSPRDQPPISILDLEGLGRDLWSGVDAARHVATERASWD